MSRLWNNKQGRWSLERETRTLYYTTRIRSRSWRRVCLPSCAQSRLFVGEARREANLDFTWRYRESSTRGGIVPGWKESTRDSLAYTFPTYRGTCTSRERSKLVAKPARIHYRLFLQTRTAKATFSETRSMFLAEDLFFAKKLNSFIRPDSLSVSVSNYSRSNRLFIVVFITIRMEREWTGNQLNRSGS